MTSPFDAINSLDSAVFRLPERTTPLDSLISMFTQQKSPQIPAVSQITDSGGGIDQPAASPMGDKASKNMAGYVAPEIGDPQATGLDPHQKAFLNAVSAGESRGRYDVRYTPQGGATFSDMSKHPGIFETRPDTGEKSSAAGRYQFTKTTWDGVGGGSFDPVTQDIRAWQLAQSDYNKRTGRDLDADLKFDGFTPTIAKALAPTWEALGKSPKQAQMVYEQSLKKYGTEQVAGDVLPLPIAPGPNTGNTNQSADYATGKLVDPKVAPLPMGTLEGWMNRVQNRKRSSIDTTIDGSPVLKDLQQQVLVSLTKVEPDTFDRRFWGHDPSRYPSTEDAAKYGKDAAYGTPRAAYLEDNASAKVNNVGFPEVQKSYTSGEDLKGKKATVDQFTQTQLRQAELATKKSPLAAIGFDPSNTFFTRGSDTNILGFFDPRNKQIWQNQSSPNTIIHESIHRGIDKLEETGEYRKLAQSFEVPLNGKTNETVTRALMYKHFGDVESERSGGNRNQQMNDGRVFAMKHGDFLNALEERASQFLAQRQTKGPK